MPTTGGVPWTPQQLLDHFRFNINQFVDNSIATFTPYNNGGVNDAPLWQSSDPTGSLLHLNMAINGSVVVSGYNVSNPNHAQMIVSTVRTPLDARHPVSGNRVFGIMASQTPGNYIFYTSAVDRVTTGFWDLLNDLGELTPIIPSGFESADNLWRSLQTKMANFIVANGGKAGSTAGVGEVTYRPPWILWKEFLKGNITLEQFKAMLGC